MPQDEEPSSIFGKNLWIFPYDVQLVSHPMTYACKDGQGIEVTLKYDTYAAKIQK